MTTVIVGTGVLAIVAAQQAYHQKNDWAQRTGNAMRLANEVHELTLPLPAHDPISGHGSNGTLGPESDETQPQADPDSDSDIPVVSLDMDQHLDYDDLDDFAGSITGNTASGVRFSPPINALREPIADLERWSQTVKVENVDPHKVNDFARPLGSTDATRVTVTIKYRENDGTERTVTSLRWLVMK